MSAAETDAARQIVRAKAEAEAARADLIRTLAVLQDRLDPREIARKGWEEVRDRGEVAAERSVAFARRQPEAIAGAAFGVTLFAVRKPIGRLLRRLFTRKKKATKDQASEPSGAMVPGMSASNCLSTDLYPMELSPAPATPHAVKEIQA